MKIIIQGVELSPEQTTLLRDIVREAVGEYAGLSVGPAVVELHRLLLPIPMQFDPRPELRVGVDRGPLLGPRPNRELEEEWERYDRSRR